MAAGNILFGGVIGLGVDAPQMRGTNISHLWKLR
jgi:hypothetical protein